MKKSRTLVLLLLPLFLLAGCNNSNSGGSGGGGEQIVITRTVKFVSNGGTTYEDTVVNDGDYVRLPTPSRGGYIFSGWYLNPTFTGDSYSGIYMPTESVTTFYARWTEQYKTFTVHFDVEEIDDIVVSSHDNTITLPTPSERYGYRFDGWKLSPNGEIYTGEYTVNTNLTFYSVFSEVSYLYLYINEGTDYERLEYAPGDVVFVSSLPIPEDYVVDGISCPFVKWTLENGEDAPTEILMDSEPSTLVAQYDKSNTAQKIRLINVDEGKYKSTGKGIKAFGEVEKNIGAFSVDVELYRSNSGAAGVAFMITDSGNDYAFEDSGTSYLAAVVSGSTGAVSLLRVLNGSYKLLKQVALASLPESFKTKYNALNYTKVTITAFVSSNTITVYLDGEEAFNYTDAATLSDASLSGTGYGYRASAANYYVSNFKHNDGTKINLDSNGGDPLGDENYYWDGGNTVSLPNATTSTPNRIFDDWYYDQECTQKVIRNDYHFDENTTLYAGYREPQNTYVVDNGDGTSTISAKTAVYMQDVEYERYAVSADLTFTKASGTTFGLFIKGNIKSDNGYEAGNSYLAFQFTANAGGLQFSKTGNGANFAHQYITSVLTGTRVKSVVSNASYLGSAWTEKFASYSDGEQITANMRIENYGDWFDVYFDDIKLFTSTEVDTLFAGLDGNAVGFKSNAAGNIFSSFKVEELEDPYTYITLDVNGGDALEEDVIKWDGSLPISLPTPTTSVADTVFKGWYYDSDCTQLVDPETFFVSGDTTLYAGWANVPKVTIHLDVNGGDELENDSLVWDGSLPISLPTPTTSVPNRVFSGWYYDSDCTDAVNVNTFEGDDTTILYAGWRLPTTNKVSDNGDNTYSLIKGSATFLDNETSFEKYRASTTLSFKKSYGSSFGIFFRGDIKSDNSYESGNSYLCLQLIPASGSIQFSKTTTTSNFSHQYITSVLAGAEYKSSLGISARAACFDENYINKFANASSDDTISVTFTIEDYGDHIDVYIDGVHIFIITNTTTNTANLFNNLSGKGMGIKGNAIGETFTKFQVSEITE